MEERRGAEEGEETFREELLTQMSERMGAKHYREGRSETAEALAGGDDDDGRVDRRASGDGHARFSEPSLGSPEEAGRGVADINN